jgi:hypothetical protein
VTVEVEEEFSPLLAFFRGNIPLERFLTLFFYGRECVISAIDCWYLNGTALSTSSGPPRCSSHRTVRSSVRVIDTMIPSSGGLDCSFIRFERFRKYFFIRLSSIYVLLRRPCAHWQGFTCSLGVLVLVDKGMFAEWF